MQIALSNYAEREHAREKERLKYLSLLIEDMFSPRLGGGLTPIFSLMKQNDLCQDLQKQNKKHW